MCVRTESEGCQDQGKDDAYIFMMKAYCTYLSKLEEYPQNPKVTLENTLKPALRESGDKIGCTATVSCTIG
jgi:hypothetical protein